MDRIEGIPEGYRLGKTLLAEYALGHSRPTSITFELIPIEQPKQLEAELLPGECPHCHCFPAREFHAVNCKTNDHLKPKQLEAVIVLPINEGGHHYEAAMESMVRQGITEDLAEWFEVQLPDRVTIREREKGR